VSDISGVGYCSCRILFVSDIVRVGYFWCRILFVSDISGVGYCSCRIFLVSDTARVVYQCGHSTCSDIMDVDYTPILILRYFAAITFSLLKSEESCSR
jgi:hypothetical protein